MYYPLSSSHLVFLKNPETAKDPAWNSCYYAFFDLAESFDALEKALNEVIRQSDSLRSRVIYQEDGTPCFAFDPFEPRSFVRLQFATEKELLAWANSKADISVFEAPGMWEAYLIEVAGRRGFFGIAHHAVCDGMTGYVLCRKIATVLAGGEIKEDSSIQHLVSEKDYRESQRFLNDRAYWEKVLPDGRAPFAFGGDFLKGCQTTIAGFEVPGVSSFCHENRLHESSFFYSLVALSLLRLCGLNQVAIGAPVLGRLNAAEFDSIGLYMRPVPLIADLSNEGFLSFARKMENQLFNAFRHQGIASFDLGRGPLFDVMVDYSSFPKEQGFELRPFYNHRSSVALEVHFLKKESGEMDCTLRTYDGLFYGDANHILFNAMTALAASAIRHPRASVRTLELLLPKESQLFESINQATDSPFPKESVYSLIDNKSTESESFILSEEKRYSIRELLCDAEKIDTRIGGKKRQVIGVICERSYEELAAIYGIIRGGNAYLPISPDYPQERIEQMLSISGCKLVLAQRKYCHRLPSLCIEDILASEKPSFVRKPKAKPSDPLYVMFTSGSTGLPKGVVVSNRSVVNRINWMCKRYFGKDTLLMHKSPFTFDVSVWELFGFAMCGFSLYLLPPEEHFSSKKMVQRINEWEITDIQFVPTLLKKFLEEADEQMPSLRNIFSCGEKLTADHLRPLYSKKLCSPKIHNLYGPTECTIDVAAYDCSGGEDGDIPIGRPIDNCRLFVLDGSLNLLPPGVLGELYVSGVCLAIGYRNNKAATSKAFLANPFGRGRLYRTGDLAYWNEKSELVIVGRRDNQVKIHGQRVEIGEIESVIRSAPGVFDAVVLIREDKLFGIYAGPVNPNLRAFVASKLPRHMVPQFFIRLETLPTNANGKVDRKVLQELAVIPKEKPTSQESDSLASKIAALFSTTLNNSEVSVEDDFFDLGGTSLDVMELLMDPLMGRVSPSDFMAHPSPRELAEFINGEADETSVSHLYEPECCRDWIVLFPYGGGDANAYSELMKAFRTRKAKTGLLFVPWGSDYSRCSSYLEKLMETGTISFYSHCAGSSIAMRILDMLLAKGFRPKRVILAADVPPRPRKGRNLWNYVSDGFIVRYLIRAGLPKTLLEEEKGHKMIESFRTNVQEYFDYFDGKRSMTDCHITVLLMRGDPFTKKAGDPKKRWKKYVAAVDEVHMLKNGDHYFQQSAASELADILLREGDKNVS